MESGKPNTNQTINGRNPRAILKDYAGARHICDRCRSRWVPANQVYCDPCVAKIAAYAATQRRKQKEPKRKDINPKWVEVVFSPDLAGEGLLMLDVLSDVGKLLTVRKLNSIDIRDALKGKAEILAVRPKNKKE